MTFPHPSFWIEFFTKRDRGLKCLGSFPSCIKVFLLNTMSINPASNSTSISQITDAHSIYSEQQVMSPDKRSIPKCKWPLPANSRVYDYVAFRRRFFIFLTFPMRPKFFFSFVNSRGWRCRYKIRKHKIWRRENPDIKSESVKIRRR